MKKGNYLSPDGAEVVAYLPAVPGVSPPVQIIDHTSYIQNEINQAGNSSIYLAEGTFNISNSLVFNTDNQKLYGSGRETVLNVLSTFPANAPVAWFQGPGGAGNFRFGSGVYDLRILNNNVATAIGIQLDSTYWAKIHRVDVEGIYSNSVFLNGISGAFGAYTSVDKCHIGVTPGAPTSAGIGLITSNHEFITITDSTFNWFSQAGGFGIKFQNGSNVVKGCTFDECDTAIWNWFQKENTIVDCQFDRGVTRFIYLNGCSFTTVANNKFQSFVGSGSKNQIDIDGGSSNASNSIHHNVCKTGTTWTNFVSETGGTYTTPNTYDHNDTGGLGVVRLTSTAGGGLFDKNRGYNPLGNLTPPGLPASGTALLNPFGVDCNVLVTGGTVTNIAIGGANTGLISGWFRIAANQTITWTGSVAPSWIWYGD